MSLESLKVDLSGQTAIVTGASQGLGRAIAIALGEMPERESHASPEMPKNWRKRSS